MTAFRVQERAGGVRFSVHVQPRASSTELCGVHGDALKVRLQAAPVEGAANDALVSFLAGALGVSRRAVRVVAGGTGRAKVIEADGVGAERVRALAPG